MADLATIDDLAALFGQPIAPSDQPRVQALIHSASVAVRSYTNQSFTVEQVTQRIRPVGDRLIVPRKPVVSIDSLSVIYYGNTLPVPFWAWDGGQEVYLSSGELVVNMSDTIRDILRFHTPLVQVTYTAGYSVVPDDVHEVVCQKVLRVLETPGSSAMSSQTAGPFAYRLSNAAQAGILGFTDDERRVLNQYRKTAQTIELR